MGETAPIIYLLNGEDEYAIAEYVNELERKLGDPATAALNTTRLDGNAFSLDQLPSIANALPFLARRRLVILTHPLARLSGPGAKEAQKRFTDLLEKIPATTALVLVENRQLTSDKDREKGKHHWLESWALEHKEITLVQVFRAPKGAEMIKRIQRTAKDTGGQISLEAAELLASLVDNDPRLADKEVEKLLAYVNYKRPIDYDDVQAVTTDTSQGDIFALVDALGAQNGRQAMGMLQRLLEYQDYYSIFGMIVRQFRLLILAREVIDRGGQKGDIQRELHQHPYVAEKLLGQARRFALPELERVYRRLVEIDEAVKTSQMPDRLALETFVSAFTTPQPPQTSR
jgi:DNA polymerase-3 subunit delta